MKAVIVGPVYPYRGGIAHYTAMLAQAMERAGHVVKVISFRRQYPAWLYPGESDRDPSRQPIGFSATYPLDPLYPWTWEQTVQSMAREAPGLVIIQWWTTFWAPALAYIAARLRQMKIRVVFVIHNVIPHEARFWDKWLVRLALGQARTFVTLSSRQKERLLSLFPSAHVIEGSLPLNSELAGQKVSKETARQQLGIPGDLPVVLFFGIVRPYKGLKHLVAAVSRLKQSARPVFLLAAGEFWEDIQVYRGQIEQLGLQELVRLDNRYIPNEEIPALFSAADLFAAPYISGTQSGVIKMALSFGLPMVVTEAIAEDAFLRQVVRGVQVVPPADAGALAEGIVRCLDAPSLEQQPLFAHFSEDWDCLINAFAVLGEAGEA